MTGWKKLGFSSFYFRRTGDTSAELRVVSKDELNSMKPNYRTINWETKEEIIKYPNLAPEETCQFAYDGSEDGYRKGELKRYHQYLNRLIRITAETKEQCDSLCNGLNELLNTNYLGWHIGSDDECVCEEMFTSTDADVHYFGSYDYENMFSDLAEKTKDYIKNHTIRRLALWVCVHQGNPLGLTDISEFVDEKMWKDAPQNKQLDDGRMLIQYMFTESKQSAHLLLW